MSKGLSVSVTDFQIKSFIHLMWEDSHNLEVENISSCFASRLRVKNTPEFKNDLHIRIKKLVKNKELRVQKFLPGRPYYTIS